MTGSTLNIKDLKIAIIRLSKLPPSELKKLHKEVDKNIRMLNNIDATNRSLLAGIVIFFSQMCIIMTTSEAYVNNNITVATMGASLGILLLGGISWIICKTPLESQTALISTLPDEQLTAIKNVATKLGVTNHRVTIENRLQYYQFIKTEIEWILAKKRNSIKNLIQFSRFASNRGVNSEEFSSLIAEYALGYPKK